MKGSILTDRLKRASLLLVLAGLAITGYLAWIKLGDSEVLCAAGGVVNCELVQNSAWSRLAGVDVVWLGLLAWLTFGALLLFEARVDALREYGPLLVVGLSLFGFLFSLWLIYVQARILQTWCLWCLAHELVMTLMFVVSAARARLLLAA